MNIDADTIDALGASSRWDECAWLYAARTREQNARWEASRTKVKRAPRKRPSAAMPVRKRALTTAQRREATRRARLGHSARIIAAALGVKTDHVTNYLRSREAA